MKKKDIIKHNEYLLNSIMLLNNKICVKDRYISILEEAIEEIEHQAEYHSCDRKIILEIINSVDK